MWKIMATGTLRAREWGGLARWFDLPLERDYRCRKVLGRSLPSLPASRRLLNWLSQYKPWSPNGGLWIKAIYPGLPVANFQKKY
ncbi:hypothetical protein MUG91_G23n85 [Manis pentadactyla]|nr:hypothetical protein MUG91_G23n85 [Manis pentadactyla]